MQILSLPASSGAAWMRDGWRLLKRQPLGLAAMVVLYTFLLFVPFTIPIPYLAFALPCITSPFATVGVMAAFRDVAAARMPTPLVFAQPLQDRAMRRVLLRLGLIHAGLMILVVVFATLFNEATVAPGETDTPKLGDVRVPELWLLLVLYAPVMVTMWFAPMLAGWHGLDVGKAMFASAVAWWRNKAALLVYGVLMGCVATAGWFAANLLGVLVSDETRPMFGALIWLALVTYAQASLYPMYRSIFTDDPA